MAACDVCLKRSKSSVAVSVCETCIMNFCQDCHFTHSNIPACNSHAVRVTSPGSAVHEGTSVDLQDHSSSLSTDGDIDDDEVSDAASAESSPRFHFQHEFPSASDKDEVNPDIRNVVVLKSEIILATDWGNCSVKAFNKKGLFLGDHFFGNSGKDAGRPHGMTLTKDNKVCITIPSFKKIATVTVKHNGKTVHFSPVINQTTRRYFGIAHMAEQKQLIAGTTDSVDILTYSCQKLQSLSKHFANPYNMDVFDQNLVLVSDTKTNCLFRISGDQEVEKICVGDRNLQLRGVTADSFGNIYFCGLQNQGIGWINSSKDYMGDLLSDSLTKCVGIHVQKVGSSHLAAISQTDGTIKIYLLKYCS